MRISTATTVISSVSEAKAKIEKEQFLSAFLTEKWQSQNFGRELVFSADLCYNGANEKPFSGRKVARVA